MAKRFINRMNTVGECQACQMHHVPCDSSCKPTPDFVRRASDAHAQAIGDAIAEEFDMPLMEVRTSDQDSRFVTITRLEHLRLLAIEECAHTLIRDRINIELHFQDLRGCLKPAPQPQEKPA